MFQTLIRIFESKKFVMAILATIAAVAAKKGWDVDTTTVLACLTPVMVAIGAEGWADSSPAAAEKQKVANEYRETQRVKKLALRDAKKITSIGVLLLLVISCSGHSLPSGSDVKNSLIDCTLQTDKSKIDQERDDLQSILSGTADWSKIEDHAVVAGATIGGCALAELVQDYLGGRSAPPREIGQRARATLEDFRNHTARGATFHTPAGDL